MIGRLRWMWKVDRLGPDVPLTHVFLHSRRLGRWIARRKFGGFAPGAEFRPYAYAVCTRRIHLGANVVIRPGCMLFAGESEGGEIVIEDEALLGSGVHIYCDNHAFSDPTIPILWQGWDRPLAVRICRGAWIGANAILLPGVTVGENAVIGAGAVVTRDVPKGAVALGVPARVVRSIAPEPMTKAI